MISTVSTVKNKIGQTDVLCLVKILCPILWSSNGFNLVSAGQSATAFSDSPLGQILGNLLITICVALDVAHNTAVLRCGFQI